VGGHLREGLPRAPGEGDVHCAHHAAGDVRLHREDVGHRGVERLRPPAHGRRVAGRDLDELGSHAHARGLARRGGLGAYGAGEQILHAELARDVLQRLGRAPVLVGARARDHLHAGTPASLLRISSESPSTT
jgi:hypothetical protein